MPERYISHEQSSNPELLRKVLARNLSNSPTEFQAAVNETLIKIAARQPRIYSDRVDLNY